MSDPPSDDLADAAQDRRSHGANGAWVRDWIQQQRDLLERAARGATTDETGKPGAAADPWIDLAATWHRVWAGVQSLGNAATQGFAQALLQLPAVGLAREQMLAWREVAAAQVACQKLEAELRVVLTRVQGDALTLLEQRVRERVTAGQQVASLRELYDLWIECGERAFAQVAHSEAYCKLQGELGNAVTHLRARQQAVIEHALRHFDLPTRAELNTVHRQVRELRDRLADCEARLAARNDASGEGK
jgi:class III poly(R)-hydroxyalkanoic acid synthase PhaE subunit